jgi:hypothetical protein
LPPTETSVCDSLPWEVNLRMSHSWTGGSRTLQGSGSELAVGSSLFCPLFAMTRRVSPRFFFLLALCFFACLRLSYDRRGEASPSPSTPLLVSSAGGAVGFCAVGSSSERGAVGPLTRDRCAAVSFVVAAAPHAVAPSIVGGDKKGSACSTHRVTCSTNLK